MRKYFVGFVVVISTSIGMGCSADDTIIAPPLPASELYWTLQINYPAIRLSMNSPYDTVTLQASPYTSEGRELTAGQTPGLDESPTIWYSTDSARVRVNADGVVSARAITETRKIYVVARRQIQNVTREDRALVQVVNIPAPPVIASFRARPADSLKRAAGQIFTMIPRILGQDSVPVTGLPVHYRSSNTIVATIADAWSGTVRAGSALLQNTIGTSKITASTWAYGVLLRDTFTVETGWALSLASFNPHVDIKSINGVAVPSLGYPLLDIGPGGTIGFSNNSGVKAARVLPGSGLQATNGKTVNIIFDDSMNVKAAGAGFTPTADGNIYGISGDTLSEFWEKAQYRRFPKPGRYEYTMQPYGFRGVIVVHDR